MLAACACAREALVYLPEGEERPKAAVEVAERWARDEADEAECAGAAETVERCAAEAPDPSVTAAAGAALAAVRAVASPEDASMAASAAAEAAMHDAGDCAMLHALRYVQATCADHVRRYVSVTWA